MERRHGPAYGLAMPSWNTLRVEDAGFSPRTRGALIHDQRDRLCCVDDWGPLTTMGEVAALSDHQLLGRPGFGPKALAEVRQWFARQGVSR